MTAPAHTTQTWRFGIFEVDARQGELRRGGVPVKMREQSFRILVFLLEHAGQIVTREDLREVLWPSDIFVDFEHSLNTAVMKLREALSDTAEAPLYIGTIPRRGYRFIAPVAQPAEFGHEPTAANGESASPGRIGNEDAPQPISSPREVALRLRRFALNLPAGLGLLLLAVLGAVVGFRAVQPPASPVPRARSRQPFQLSPSQPTRDRRFSPSSLQMRNGLPTSGTVPNRTTSTSMWNCRVPAFPTA